MPVQVHIPLTIRKVRLINDEASDPQPGEALPERYSVGLYVNRPMTAFESASLAANSGTGLVGTEDRILIKVLDTTLQEVRGRLPELQAIVTGIEEEAAEAQRAAEELGQARNAEAIRRQKLVEEINKELEQGIG